MIIPVRCVTCGKVIADRWRAYQRKVAADREQQDREQQDREQQDDQDTEGRTPPEVGLIGPSAARALDEMGITKMCCRRHFLTNVDAMHRI